MTRDLTHQSQQGVDVRVGDDVILEWGVGKAFRPDAWKPWVAQLDVGVVGYGQWQSSARENAMKSQTSKQSVKGDRLQ